MKRGLLALVPACIFPVVSLLAGCPSGGVDLASDAGGDAGFVIPTTAACAGDATRCLSGTLTTKLFTAVPTAAKVELYRVFPNGAITPIKTTPLAKDGKFAFSDLDAWGHYYLKGIVKLGEDAGASSIGVLRGRLAVPSVAGQSIDLVAVPVQLEVLETQLPSSARALQWISARVYDPASGHELTDAQVTFRANGLAPATVPYVTNAGGAKSYFLQFSPAVAANGGYAIDTAHASFGTPSPSWDMSPEGSLFEPAITAPQPGASVAVGQPLEVSWPAQPLADYVVVELFARQANGSFVQRYGSAAALSPEIAKETIPGSALKDPGSYLLNVNLAQGACGGGARQGCVYLLHPATATLIAQ